MWKKTSAQMLPFVSLCNVADFCYNLMTNPCSEYLSTTCLGDNKRHSKLAHWWCYLMNPLKELHWLVISTMPPASNIYIISQKKKMSVICFILFMLNIVSPLAYTGFPLRCVPSFACWIFGVSPISRSSRESFWAKELLDAAGSCSVDWSDFNVLLIFWFIFFCSSLHIHTLTLSSSWGTGKSLPSQALVPVLVCSHPALPKTRVQN